MSNQMTCSSAGSVSHDEHDACQMSYVLKAPFITKDPCQTAGFTGLICHLAAK